ncbi:MAG: right-handed parallel beta-helix repeat-containing protein [Clostridia bacterium]|nr:right-handed parallel beta-helix repeat-containing protein [Clostridia bacterium]
MFDLNQFRTADGYKIPAGIHYLTEPVKISENNIRIYGEDGAVLRGTLRLTRKDFTEDEPGVWTASVPCKVDAFYVGDRKYTMARYPKANRPNEPFGGYNPDCTFPSKTADWADPTGGYIHAMHVGEWCGCSYRIDGKNEDGTLILTGGWQNNIHRGMHRDYRYAENIREEMTGAGEWFFDEKNNRIYVRPVEGDDFDTAEVAVAQRFFTLENCENVTIENITFERSVRTFMDCKEPLLRSDWAIHRNGVVFLGDCQNCTIDRCAFYDIGSNAVFVDGNSAQISVMRSHFRELGASGVCFVGYPDSVRSPLFQYYETHTLAEFDKEQGPKSDHYPKNCLVEDCLMEHIGFAERQVAGVHISMAYGITVRNCTICHTTRAGINVSEGTFGGHLIEGCDVFDTVRDTSDHGSFNSWGRDRFWHVPDLEPHDTWKYAKLDIVAPTVITRNRFRCDHGWDIDLDDGSTDYIITENLCLSGGIKLREGFFRQVHHNVTVNNTLHSHDWYPESGDVVENNVFCAVYRPYAMPKVWGKRIDGNVLHVSGQTDPIPAAKLAEISGDDDESICLDVGFADPAAGDFTPTNPLVKGFENFPTEFGVRYAPLRAIAETPILPVLQTAKDAAESVVKTIQGITVKNVETDGEMSLHATSRHNGAIVLDVEEGTVAWQRGIRPNDVIVRWGNDEINCIDDLLGRTFLSTTTLIVLRRQKPTEL